MGVALEAGVSSFAADALASDYVGLDAIVDQNKQSLMVSGSGRCRFA